MTMNEYARKVNLLTCPSCGCKFDKDEKTETVQRYEGKREVCLPCIAAGRAQKNSTEE